MGPTTGAVFPTADVLAYYSFTHIWEQAHGALRYRLFDEEAEAAA